MGRLGSRAGNHTSAVLWLSSNCFAIGFQNALFALPGDSLVLGFGDPYKGQMSSSDPHPARPDTGVVVEESRPEVKQPPLYRVILLNDDYTPMEFVVDVLEKFFAMNRPTATRIMLEVHTKGKGVCGVFTYEIAETKVAQVTTYARDHQHPLMCTLEEA
jgi:ATP-dependent Clp protease adaptor protein ClpS